MRILVEHGKHGTSYYDATDDDKLARACLYIMRRGFEDGWYAAPDETRIAQLMVQDAAALTDDQINALPSENLKRTARQERSNTRNNLRWYEGQKDWYSAAKAAVEADDPGQMIKLGRGRHERLVPLAWHLIHQRQDSEYERTELVETVELSEMEHA